jgi:hypothetical protein
MRKLKETESRVNFFKQGAGRTPAPSEVQLNNNERNITMQIRPINNVINRFKRLIDAILIRYDNYIYYKQLERFYKDNRSNYQKLKDKVNLAIACLSKNISKYNGSSDLDSHPHSLFMNSLTDGQLRRTKRNRVK